MFVWVHICVFLYVNVCINVFLWLYKSIDFSLLLYDFVCVFFLFVCPCVCARLCVYFVCLCLLLPLCVYLGVFV